MELILMGGGLLLFLLFVASHLFSKLHLPTLLSYILVGLLLSGLIQGRNLLIIHDIAQIGIILMFFQLGLDFPLNHLINISKRIWRIGAIDIILNFGVSTLLAYVLNFGLIEALILGGVCYATSSSITIKALGETNREQMPESEFKLALLIFEDIAAPVLVSVLTALELQGRVELGTVVYIVITALFMTLISILFAKYVFSRLELFIKRFMTEDYILLFIMAVAFLISGIAVYFQLSKLLGAFLAGVMISETNVGEELTDQIAPIKNILLPFFFFWFGTSITVEAGFTSPIALIALVMWSLIGKFIVGLLGGRLYGLSMKGSLRSGMSLTQRGEFSVIIASLGTPTLLSFSGIYIIITALIGLLLFYKSPVWANYLYYRLALDK